MPAHPVVAVAASAGGVEALKRFVSDLDPQLPATVLVALHLPPGSQTLLTQILRRRTALPVHDAVDGEPLKPGEILVAQPDRHLLVVDDHVVLGPGARENGHRPSHDAMLRSVGISAGPHAVGVVLTGLLDDGSAGLRVVSRYGGTCLVQDPDDAEFPSMPRHALDAVPSARRVSLAGLAEEVRRAVTEEPSAELRPVPDEVLALDVAELRSALGESPTGPGGEPIGTPSPYACPDCHGVLNEMPQGEPLRFRCRTGHAWSAESLLARQTNDVEAALWTALRVLEERAQIAQSMSDTAEKEKRDWSAHLFRRRAAEATRAAEQLRVLLLEDVEQESDVEREVDAT